MPTLDGKTQAVRAMPFSGGTRAIRASASSVQLISLRPAESQRRHATAAAGGRTWHGAGGEDFLLLPKSHHPDWL